NPTYNNLVILPTYRDPASHLALSSRNAYLLPEERPWATVLVDALDKSQEEWDRQRGEGSGEVDVQKVIAVAEDHVRSVERQAEAEGKGVQIKLLYIAMNDPDELHDLRDKVEKGKGAIVSGAVMLGKTRLIDNIVFEYDSNPQ
ncbi:hypothetical protein NBRC10512_002993, partial [Rhodotorula toruloides]